jgi:hypothetical protein
MPQGKGTYGSKVGRPPKKKKNYDPKKGTPNAVKSMTAKTQGSGKPIPMPTVKSKSKAITKGFYAKPTVRVVENKFQKSLKKKK